MNSICPLSTPEITQKRRELTPNQLAAFEAFSRAVFADGALPAKCKQIIAVVVARVTPMPARTTPKCDQSA
jgi:alkylhydroperoxidase/carboxymuconolactone decarboxylase family protein YurZ